MSTNRLLMAFGTTLALTLIIGSVLVPMYSQRALQARIHDSALYISGYAGNPQGRLKSASDDIGDQYSDGNTRQVKTSIQYASRLKARAVMAAGTQYEPYYMNSNYAMGMVENKRLGAGLVAADGMNGNTAYSYPNYYQNYPDYNAYYPPQLYQVEPYRIQNAASNTEQYDRIHENTFLAAKKILYPLSLLMWTRVHTAIYAGF